MPEIKSATTKEVYAPTHDQREPTNVVQSDRAVVDERSSDVKILRRPHAVIPLAGNLYLEEGSSIDKPRSKSGGSNAIAESRSLEILLYFNPNTLDSVSLILGKYYALSWDSIFKFLMANPIHGYPLLVAVTSLAAFLMYGWDKRQAKTGGWRIPEKQLHGLAFLGGWPGAMLGQKYFRHKTQKIQFKIITWLAAGLHVILVLWYLYSSLAGQ